MMMLVKPINFTPNREIEIALLEDELSRGLIQPEDFHKELKIRMKPYKQENMQRFALIVVMVLATIAVISAWLVGMGDRAFEGVLGFLLLTLTSFGTAFFIVDRITTKAGDPLDRKYWMEHILERENTWRKIYGVQELPLERLLKENGRLTKKFNPPKLIFAYRYKYLLQRVPDLYEKYIAEEVIYKLPDNCPPLK